ncbi:MAG: winged helix-turn-helix transcriptional regulator [Planctomycetes bacterium]|nr:winged helix-turn-helix transcriptional regulator [Planctomycetota bacterium]
MPYRALIAKELADLLNVLSHPHRIRIVEELRQSERDVNSLKDSLNIPHSGVSQHLTLLRNRRLVVERRQGRQVFYRLCQPELATWLMEATRFIEGNTISSRDLGEAIQKARKAWSA